MALGQGKDLAAEPDMQCYGVSKSAYYTLKGLDDKGYPINIKVLLGFGMVAGFHELQINEKYVDRMKVSPDTVGSALLRIDDAEYDRVTAAVDKVRPNGKDEFARAVENYFQSRLTELSCVN